MKYIVTGVCGLLGSHILKKLCKEKHEVIGIDNLFSGYFSNIYAGISEFIEADLNDFNKVKEALEKAGAHNAAAIIHCAALPYEGVSVYSPHLISKNIVSATTSVGALAIYFKIPRVINFSSMARYGDQQTPFTEDMPTKGIDPYGLSKIHAEEHLNLLSDIHGLHVTHVVPHNVSGPNQIFNDPYRNVLSIFINRHLHGKPPIIYGDGMQMRSFSHVVDCVAAVMKIINSTDLPSKEVFNIGPDDGTEITVRELATIVATTLGKEDIVTYLPDRPREVKHAWVSVEKAKRVLDYKITKDVRQTVCDTAEWILMQPKRDFKYHLELEFTDEKTPTTWTQKLM